jgi:hypothetical protein
LSINQSKGLAIWVPFQSQVQTCSWVCFDLDFCFCFLEGIKMKKKNKILFQPDYFGIIKVKDERSRS